MNVLFWSNSPVETKYGPCYLDSTNTYCIMKKSGHRFILFYHHNGAHLHKGTLTTCKAFANDVASGRIEERGRRVLDSLDLKTPVTSDLYRDFLAANATHGVR